MAPPSEQVIGTGGASQHAPQLPNGAGTEPNIARNQQKKSTLESSGMHLKSLT